MMFRPGNCGAIAHYPEWVSSGHESDSSNAGRQAGEGGLLHLEP
jgi:hypothetical protein